MNRAGQEVHRGCAASPDRPPAVTPCCRFSEGRDPSGLSFSEPWDPRRGGFSEVFPPHVTPRYVPFRPPLGPGGVHGLSRGHDAGGQRSPAAVAGAASPRSGSPRSSGSTSRPSGGMSPPRGRAAWPGRRDEALDDGLIAAVVSRVQPTPGPAPGDGWERVRGPARRHRALPRTSGVRLSKVRKLLRRQGVDVQYATLRRFAIAELGFGATAPRCRSPTAGPAKRSKSTRAG